MEITVVQPGWEYPKTTLEMLDILTRHVECCGRVCYKSEDRITDDSAPKFVEKICRRRHESVLEHATITVFVTCSRSCSHQLVRHRIAAYSQESQRYCNYGKLGLKVICPPWVGLDFGTYLATQKGWLLKEEGPPIPAPFDYDKIVKKIEKSTIFSAKQLTWLQTVKRCYIEYLSELDQGAPPEDARYVLPNATKTEIAVTYNARMWRHVFQERALNKAAQWEIRGIFKSILDDFAVRLPSMFEDLTND